MERKVERETGKKRAELILMGGAHTKETHLNGSRVTASFFSLKPRHHLKSNAREKKVANLQMSLRYSKVSSQFDFYLYLTNESFLQRNRTFWGALTYFVSV